jgi:hypothetical protein
MGAMENPAPNSEKYPDWCERCLERSGTKRPGGIQHDGHELCSSCYFELAVVNQDW